jgi:iron complex outermembrane recepter protein
MKTFTLVSLTTTALATNALLGLLATPAMAQGASTQTAPQAADTQAAAPAQPAALDKEIVVTGTLIRGVAPVGSSVIAVGRSDMVESGLATTEDILKSVPQITNIGPGAVAGANTQNSNLNNTRAEAINIRGIGPQATLALLDGRRLPANGAGAQLFDASALPAIALARVDVVADGASATYGSDAVAGVANFILRKDVEGLEVTGRYNFADQYHSQQVGIIAGHHWSNGAFMIAGQYDQNSHLYQSDRAKYYQCNETAYGYANSCVTASTGAPAAANLTSPGNLVFTGANAAVYGLPAGSGVGVTQAQLSSTANSGSNTANQDVIPAMTRYSIIYSGHVDVSPSITLWSEGYWSRRNVQIAGGYLNTAGISVPNTNPNFVTVAGQSATSETVQYAFVNEYGAVMRTGYEQTWQASGGLDAKLFNDYKLTAYYEHNNNLENLVQPGINTPLLAAALSCTTSVCFNPYGSGTSASNIAAAQTFIGSTIQNAYYDSNLVNAKIDGSLFHMGGGDTKIAVGGEWHWDKIFNYNTQNTTSTNINQMLVSSNTRYSRKVASVFAELVVPIVSADNALPGIQKLTLDVAGRYDHYSDVGGTTNPKVGLIWAPVSDLTLRGSFGTSFRAPTVCDSNPLCTPAFLQSSTGSTAFYNLRNSNIVTIVGGNTNVKPETATTWSLGMDYKPSFAPNLSISLNYFNIDYKNVIYTPGQSAAALTNGAYSQFVIANPTQAQVQSYITSQPFYAGLGSLPGCATLTNANTSAYSCVGAILLGTRANAGEEKMQGLDFSVNYRLETAIGRFRAGVSGTYLFNYDVALVPGVPFVHSVNQLNATDVALGDPMRFRARAQLGYSGYGFDANAFINYVNAYSIIGVVSASQNERVPSYTTVDASLSYTFGKDSGALHDLKLAVNAINLFAAAPPLAIVSTTQQYDPANASVLGRQVSLSLTKKF